MALIKCRECGGDVSSTAKACPKCGAPVASKRTGCGTVIGGVLLGIVILAAIGSIRSSFETENSKASETPEQRAERERNDAAVQRATAGAVILKKAMRDPESFKLESALVIEKTSAVCYQYRAKNGFGGIDVGQAVLASDGSTFKTSDMDGFVRLWNKECTGKAGTDVATAIRWFAL